MTERNKHEYHQNGPNLGRPKDDTVYPTRTMTDEELVIWRAAYGSFFAAEFQHFRQHYGWDKALSMTHAETAASIANHAVLQLRYWRDREDSECGIRISQFSKLDNE